MNDNINPLVAFAKKLAEYEAQETNKNTFELTLRANIDDIVDNLGGLSAILQLCLTNPNAAEIITIGQLASLQTLIQPNTLNTQPIQIIDHLSSDTIVYESETDRDINFSVPTIDIDIIVNEINSNNHHLTKLNSSTNTNINMASNTTPNTEPTTMIIKNTNQFYRNAIIFTTNARNNLYFKHLPLPIAEWLFYTVLLGKLWLVGSSCLIVCLLVIAELIHSISETVFFTLRCIAYVIGITGGLSYALSVNIEIFQLILRTFDFWFKMYNLILWIIAFYFINVTQLPSYDIILRVLSMSGVFFCVFILDGLAVPPKLKQCVLCVIGLYFSYSVIFVYFSYSDDTNWNPFKKYNFKYSNVNFKSLYMSSLINLILFMLKPSISQAMIFFTRLYYHKRKKLKSNDANKKESKTTNAKRHNKYERCTVIYKRPKLDWINKTPSDEKDSQGKTETEQAQWWM